MLETKRIVSIKHENRQNPFEKQKAIIKTQLAIKNNTGFLQEFITLSDFFRTIHPVEFVKTSIF
jgi:hypothetical protein